MQTIKIKQLSIEVTQTDYTTEVAGSTVPYVVWTPNSKVNERLVLIGMAHGGSLHKKTKDIRLRAIRYAEEYGWVSFAIDAPGHGDRISRDESLLNMEKTAARVRGEPNAPSFSRADKIAYLDSLASESVPEWQVVLDEILAYPLVSNSASIGFWGLSMGSSIGIPLLAEDSRYQCAVLGLSELLPDHESFEQKAHAVTVPIRFIFQWDDPIRERQSGVNLFEAFGSEEKSMHINSGGHADFPKSEADSWDGFFEYHLT